MEELVKRLKEHNIRFEKGLSNEEIMQAEKAFDIKFPAEIKYFLSLSLPVSEGFSNWRDCSKKNIEKIKGFQQIIEEAFIFDFDNNSLADYFKNIFPNIYSETELRKAILNYLHSSPKLVPFYKHRCFINGMDNMPIISFSQPTDTIFYGANLSDYLEREFLSKPSQLKIESIQHKFQDTGIWKDIIW